jgi:hypothetical protein
VKLDRKTYESFGALELGIVIPSCCVKESLRQMSVEEASKAKRKWRKLKRKHSKGIANHDSKLVKQMIKREVRNELCELGKKILSPNKGK